ncbi:MAG: hypothetical protein IT312_01445 [Anaerolineales bacterium]|nr:hypothetical protein [Anaerolineales bacterium]
MILIDKRGMGLSDRVQGAPSLEDTMSDALRVLDAAASERTFVMGASEGGARPFCWLPPIPNARADSSCMRPRRNCGFAVHL